MSTITQKVKPLFFCIPLKSKAVSKNWEQVCKLLQNAVRSILNSTDPNFRILIACHDAPDLGSIMDQRISIIQVDYPVPATTEEMMIDKYYKKRWLASAVRAEGGGAVFFADADDLIHKDLCRYVQDRPYVEGFVINQGFEYDMDTGLYKKAARFNKLCGTSYIICYNESDLPDTCVFVGYVRHSQYLFDYSHAQWEERLEQRTGKKMEPVPFRGAVYVIGSGENHSILTGNIGIRRRILRLITRQFKGNPQIRGDFGIEE